MSCPAYALSSILFALGLLFGFFGPCGKGQINDRPLPNGVPDGTVFLWGFTLFFHYPCSWVLDDISVPRGKNTLQICKK